MKKKKHYLGDQSKLESFHQSALHYTQKEGKKVHTKYEKWKMN